MVSGGWTGQTRYFITIVQSEQVLNDLFVHQIYQTRG